MKTITKFQIKRNKLAQKIFIKMISKSSSTKVQNALSFREDYLYINEIVEYSMQAAGIFLKSKKDMQDESHAIEEAIVEKWKELSDKLEKGE